MKLQGSGEWARWCLILASDAPTHGSEQRCQNLRPCWDKQQLQNAMQRTQQVMHVLKKNDPFKTLDFLKNKNWLRSAIKTPAQARLFLPKFLNLVTTLQQELPLFKSLWVPFKNEVYQTDILASALLKKYKHTFEKQIEVLDEIGTYVARARYGLQRNFCLSHISQQQRWQIKQWHALKTPLDFELDKSVYTLLLTGAHGSGKSAFLKALYLLSMQHQSAVPCLKSSAALPVYAGINYFPAGQSLSERLNQLKPLLHNEQAQRLVIVDDYLTLSNAGESHALARAILEQLTRKGSLNILGTYDRMLLRLNQHGVKHLKIQNKHKKTQLFWDQNTTAELLLAARHHGLPIKLVQQAEQHLKALQTPAKTTVPVAATQPRSKPTFKHKRQILKAPPAPVKVAPPEAFKPGLKVYIAKLNQYGEVLKKADRKQKIQVRCEGLTMMLTPQDLQLSSHRQEKHHEHQTRVSPVAPAPECCDLHGLNTLEAIPVLEKHLDMAYHAGEKQLRVVHGKGTNTLRRAVHEHLEHLIINDLYAEAYRLGYHGEGDSGVTVVMLKS